MPALTVGNIALSFHWAAAAVTRRVLDEAGHRVASVEASHEQLSAFQAADHVDVLASASLPDSHTSCLAP